MAYHLLFFIMLSTVLYSVNSTWIGYVGSGDCTGEYLETTDIVTSPQCWSFPMINGVKGSANLTIPKGTMPVSPYVTIKMYSDLACINSTSTRYVALNRTINLRGLYLFTIMLNPQSVDITTGNETGRQVTNKCFISGTGSIFIVTPTEPTTSMTTGVEVTTNGSETTGAMILTSGNASNVTTGKFTQFTTATGDSIQNCPKPVILTLMLYLLISL